MLKAVLFDWDGTLADTAEATYRCYVRMFAELGIAFDRETYARTYSPNWHLTFRKLELPEERWARADERWLAHFATEPVELMEGALQTLEQLTASGIAAGIVTSGGRERVTLEIEKHGLAPHLATCVFGCDVQQKKPHPEALLLCLERMGVRPDEAVYVGDSPEDVLMARAAGVRAVAVRGGYPNGESLLASGPDAVLAGLPDLLTLLARWSRQQGPHAAASPAGAEV